MAFHLHSHSTAPRTHLEKLAATWKIDLVHGAADQASCNHSKAVLALTGLCTALPLAAIWLSLASCCCYRKRAAAKGEVPTPVHIYTSDDSPSPPSPVSACDDKPLVGAYHAAIRGHADDEGASVHVALAVVDPKPSEGATALLPQGEDAA